MLIVRTDSVLTMRKMRERLASDGVFNLLSDVIYSFNFASLFSNIWWANDLKDYLV